MNDIAFGNGSEIAPSSSQMHMQYRLEEVGLVTIVKDVSRLTGPGLWRSTTLGSPEYASAVLRRQIERHGFAEYVAHSKTGRIQRATLIPRGTEKLIHNRLSLNMYEDIALVKKQDGQAYAAQNGVSQINLSKASVVTLMGEEYYFATELNTFFYQIIATPVTPAALLYHALTRNNVIKKEVPDDVAKVEEAMQYMTPLQRGIIELYAKNIVAWRIENRFEITHYKYLKERKAAEAIIRAVIDGTYKLAVVEEPVVVEKDVQDKKGEKPKTEITKPKEEPVPELEEERLYYARRESKTVASLEEALQKSHAEARKIEKLRGKSLPDDFARIINGDATIDFLIRDQCYAVAAAYAHDVYVCAREGMVWPISDQEIQKERIKKKEQEVRAAFIAAYDTYAVAPSEDALIALFKKNLRISRGYIATVGWYFATKERTDEKRKSDFVGDQWKYKPTWKDAWTFFVPNEQIQKKKRNGSPVLLTDPEIGTYLAQGETEKILRQRYMQLWHHAETARGHLVTKYDAYIIDCAKQFGWAKMPLDDRISLGKEGFLRASQKYDPTLANTFATYARHWMKARISWEWRANTPVRVTPNMWRMIFKIQKEIRDIRKTHPSIGEESLYALVEERTAYSRKSIVNALQAHADHDNVLSLDDKAYGDGEERNEKTLHDMIIDERAPQVDEIVALSIGVKKVQSILKQLPKRQRRVLEERFWGNQGEGKTLREIGKQIGGLSGEGIRQIERNALTAVKAYIEREREEKVAQRVISSDLQQSSSSVELSDPPQRGYGCFRRQLFSLEQRLSEKTFTTAVAGLSPREQEVVDLVYTHGMHRKQVGARLGIADRTVATHVEHIRAKLASYFVAARNTKSAEPWSLLYAELSKDYPFLAKIGGKEFVASMFDAFSPTDQEYIQLQYERQMTFTKIAQVKSKSLNTVKARLEKIQKQLHDKIIAALAGEKRNED